MKPLPPATPPAPISEDIWIRKYRFGNEAGIDDTWHRVAKAVAVAEPQDQALWAERFHGLLADYRFLPGGRIPIATRGGLKARGHPVGATGMYQIVEVVQQLRGECGKTQVEGAKIGMAQNIGGSGATVITHIFNAG